MKKKLMYHFAVSVVAEALREEGHKEAWRIATNWQSHFKFDPDRLLAEAMPVEYQQAACA